MNKASKIESSRPVKYCARYENNFTTNLNFEAKNQSASSQEKGDKAKGTSKGKETSKTVSLVVTVATVLQPIMIVTTVMNNNH